MDYDFNSRIISFSLRLSPISQDLMDKNFYQSKYEMYETVVRIPLIWTDAISSSKRPWKGYSILIN